MRFDWIQFIDGVRVGCQSCGLSPEQTEREVSIAILEKAVHIARVKAFYETITRLTLSSV